MAKHERNGIRKTREELRKRRTPSLGYYLIVTDTKETERNYLYGLRDSIPEKLQGKLVIKVSKTKTSRLVEEAMELASLNPQYGEPWIVFDRDEVNDFDGIVKDAKEHGINVGWSNPCIEIWFQAYFGSMPNYSGSVKCCEEFSRKFTATTSTIYKKSDDDIYDKLCVYGDEKQAIKVAKEKFAEHRSNGKCKPSEMQPATTLYMLVEEIKNKIDAEEK